jgi:hypothetical protein
VEAATQHTSNNLPHSNLFMLIMCFSVCSLAGTKDRRPDIMIWAWLCPF